MRASAKTPKGKKTVKATTGILSETNENRQGIYICNPSTKEVWLAFGETAVKEEGLWLKKEGGSTFIDSSWGGPIACITTEGEGSVSFIEY